MANKDGTWLREIYSCCCLTTAGKTRQLLLNNIYIPFLPSLYRVKWANERIGARASCSLPVSPKRKLLGSATTNANGPPIPTPPLLPPSVSANEPNLNMPYRVEPC